MIRTVSNSPMTPPVTPLDPNVALFNSRRVRRAEVEGQPVFAALDVIGRLCDAEDRMAVWARLRQMADVSPVRCVFTDATGEVELDGLGRADVLRLVAAMESPTAKRVHAWLAERAVRADEVESAWHAELEARKTYRRRGETRRWIERRQSAKQVRRELASEWHGRGATDSAHYRQLTNALFESTFGMDVASYRRLKSLPPGASLRDHMSDTELTLTFLAETLAAQMLRRADAQGFEAVLETTRDAGRTAAAARSAIEEQFGRIATRRNHATRAAA